MLTGRIGCTEAAVNCAFRWEIRASETPGSHLVLATGQQVLDGQVDVFEIPLVGFEGRPVAFGLHLDVGEAYSSHDVGVWVAPAVVTGGG